MPVMNVFLEVIELSDMPDWERDAHMTHYQSERLNLERKKIEILEQIHRSLRLLSSETD